MYPFAEAVLQASLTQRIPKSSERLKATEQFSKHY